MSRVVLPLVLVAFAAQLLLAAPEDRETKVRNDQARINAAGQWIYNDLDAGLAEGKKSGKPVLVVFRCIPCEACEGLDQKIAARDEAIRDLLAKFVCVRIIKANALDLNFFQFDYDLSFAAFFLNADKTIYGRFGSLPTRDDDPAVAVQAFRASLEAALAAHALYPANKALFAGKTPVSPAKHAVPEEYPAHKGKYTADLNFTGKVVQSCIHCHMIRDADRRERREAGEVFSDEVLFPYPMPDALGLSFEPASKSQVASVAAGSAAEKGGFKAGDDLVTLGGQSMLSVADVQWVLHDAKTPTKLEGTVRRAGKIMPVSIELAADWRRVPSPGRRTTVWDLRRMGTGGMLLEPATDEQRKKAGVADGKLALFAKHVGQYGEHGVAARAGFKNGDILVAIDGQDQRMTEAELITYTLRQKKRGEKVKATVARGDQRLELEFVTQ